MLNQYNENVKKKARPSFFLPQNTIQNKKIKFYTINYNFSHNSTNFAKKL